MAEDSHQCDETSGKPEKQRVISPASNEIPGLEPEDMSVKGGGDAGEPDDDDEQQGAVEKVARLSDCMTVCMRDSENRREERLCNFFDLLLDTVSCLVLIHTVL